MTDHNTARESTLISLIQRVGHLDASIDIVRQDLATVHYCTLTVQQQVQSLNDDFARFVEEDRAQKELALAETGLVGLKQELESRFGFYAEIRRRATGILQATDLTLIRQETMHSVTEDLMMRAPSYWLAPALVAVSAWISDKQSLAERALAEALARDACKTSLLFCLICRRLGRHEQSLQWLTKYLSVQDPFALGRETVIVIDALAAGAFGANTSAQSMEGILGWLDEIKNRVGVIEGERTRWIEILHSMRPAVSDADYPQIAKYSPTWPELQTSLGGVRLNKLFEARLAAVFDGEVTLSHQLSERIDGLVQSLVTSFDEVELPLRRDVLKLELIKQERGLRKAAEARYKSEVSALDSEMTFVALLTDVALGRGVATVSRGTQRLAYAVSAPWILEAYDDVVTSVRASVPLPIEMSVGSWRGSTTDGRDEAQLVHEFLTALAKEEAVHVGAINGIKFWWPAAVAALCLAQSIQGGDGWRFIGFIFAVYFAYTYLKRAGTMKDIKARFAAQRQAGTDAVKSCCADIVDYWEEHRREDLFAEKVRERLAAITIDEHVGALADGKRKVLA